MISRRRFAQMLRTSPLALPVLLAASHAGAQPTDWQAKPREFQFDDHAPYPEPEPKKADADDPEAPPPPREPKVIYAPEPSDRRFGRQGEVVLTAGAGGANGASISHRGVSNSQADYFSASFEAGLDYFVIDHLSIGFDLAASHSDDQGYGADGSLVETKTTNLAAGVRLGADIPLGDTFSFYPRLTLGIESASTGENLVSGQSLSVAGNPTGGDATTRVGPWLNVYAPILVHPTRHFFVGLGPRLNHHFGNTEGGNLGIAAHSTGFGASFVVGGSWGGDAPAPVEAVEAPATGARRHHFGDRGTWVFTADTNAFATSTSYSGTSASLTEVYAAPGFDYFVDDHFSLGIDSSVDHFNEVGKTNTGATVTYVGTTVGVAFRAGFDVPISDLVSWYPRAEIGGGPIFENETSDGAQNKASLVRFWVGLDAPVLVHVARHFFVGAGPTITHDLSRTDQDQRSFPETVVGARVLIGGWL